MTESIKPYKKQKTNCKKWPKLVQSIKAKVSFNDYEKQMEINNNFR